MDPSLEMAGSRFFTGLIIVGQDRYLSWTIILKPKRIMKSKSFGLSIMYSSSPALKTWLTRAGEGDHAVLSAKNTGVARIDRKPFGSKRRHRQPCYDRIKTMARGKEKFRWV